MTTKTEVMTRDEQMPEIQSATLTPMDMIDRALANGAGVEVMEKLMGLQERWQAAQDRAEFSAAKAAAMSEMPSIPRSGKNKHTGKSYSTIDDIRDTVRPVLAKHGMTLSHRTKVQDGELVVTAVLAHANGQEDTNSLSVPFDSGQQRNAAQARGSSQTYGERYTATALLGLSRGDEDDDGRAAGNPVETITDEQATELRRLLEAAGRDEQAMCNYYRVGSLDLFPADKFGAAVKQLKAAAGERGAK